MAEDGQDGAGGPFGGAGGRSGSLPGATPAPPSRREERLRELARLYAVLSGVSQAIVRARDAAGLYRSVCQVAVEAGGFRLAWIGLLDEADGAVRPLVHAGAEDGYLGAIAVTASNAPTGRGPTGTAVREGTVVICDDIGSDPSMLPWREEALRRGYRSSAAVPFREGGRVVGTLNLYAAEAFFFKEDERHLLDDIGADISFALDALAAEQVRWQAVDSLRRSEARYRLLLDTLPHGVAEVSRGGVVTYCNRGLERILGRSERELVGQPFWQAVPPGGPQEALRRELARVAREQPAATPLQAVSTRRDGTPVELQVDWDYQLDERGELKGFISVVTDVTARRRAERALHDSEERLRFLSENLAEGMVYQIDSGRDGEQRRFTYVSPAVERLHGLRVEDVERDPALLYGQVVEEHRALVAERERRAAAERSTLDVEVEVRLPSGERRWRRFLSAPRVTPDGDLVWNGIELDVTRQKEMEDQARQREQDLLEVQRLSGIASFHWDLRTGAVAWSPELFRIVGRAAGSFPLTYAGFLAMVHPDDRDRVDQESAAAVAGARPLKVEYRLKRPDGSDRDAFSSGIVKRDGDGEPAAMIGFTQDITERKRAERLQAQLDRAQRLESIGQLAGGVAHDFNNMLGVILGHAELALLQPALAEELRGSLEGIRGAALRSADLTRQLLAFARRQTVAPRVVDLNQVVAGMLDLLRRLVGEDVELSFRPGPELWSVRVDPSQVDQVLANLCVNARDAIGGPGHVALRTENVDLDEAFCTACPGLAPGPHVLLEVQDDGSGMEPAILDHIFEPFFSTKGPGQGTGLGLATVYGIVRQNKGLITVQSAPGAGATFRIYLPRCAEAATAGEERPPGAPAPAGELVLLVEDEPSILAVGATMLRRLGYRVLTAATPAEALDLASAHAAEIRLLVTDVVMPGMNGRELAERVAGIVPGVARLLVSGYATEVITDRGVLGEGVHFLAKPFTLAELAVKVREALG